MFLVRCLTQFCRAYKWSYLWGSLHSHYSDEKALRKLEKNLGYSVVAVPESAVGYSVKVGDTYSQYYKVKCPPTEALRLAELMNLEPNYKDSNITKANAPDWMLMRKPSSTVYGRNGFSTLSPGSSVQLWIQDGYLHVAIHLWQ